MSGQTIAMITVQTNIEEVLMCHAWQKCLPSTNKNKTEGKSPGDCIKQSRCAVRHVQLTTHTTFPKFPLETSQKMEVRNRAPTPANLITAMSNRATSDLTSLSNNKNLF